MLENSKIFTIVINFCIYAAVILSEIKIKASLKSFSISTFDDVSRLQTKC